MRMKNNRIEGKTVLVLARKVEAQTGAEAGMAQSLTPQTWGQTGVSTVLALPLLN